MRHALVPLGEPARSGRTQRASAQTPLLAARLPGCCRWKQKRRDIGVHQRAGTRAHATTARNAPQKRKADRA
eukprot:5247434-Prymnesium_polylepis.1